MNYQMRFANRPNAQLEQMGRAAIVIQKYWRNRRARNANSLEILNAFAKDVVKVRLDGFEMWRDCCYCYWLHVCSWLERSHKM